MYVINPTTDRPPTPTDPVLRQTGGQLALPSSPCPASDSTSISAPPAPGLSASGWLLYTLIGLLPLLACGGNGSNTCPADGGQQVLFAVGGDRPAAASAVHWLRSPFPADSRRTSSGAPRMSDFPNPHNLSVISEYAQYIQLNAEADGFGNHSSIYFSFRQPLNPAALSADSASFVSDAAPLQLIDLQSGKRHPLRWEVYDKDGNYIRANTLAFGAIFGSPLRDGATYAAIVTDSMLAAERPAILSRALGAEVSDRCLADQDDEALQAVIDSFAPLRQFLDGQTAVDRQRIVAATVFTVRRTRAPMQAIADQVAAAAPPVISESAWQSVGADYHQSFESDRGSGLSGKQNFDVFETRVVLPIYQAGEVPYSTDGGLLLAENGTPQIVRQETVRLVLSLPGAAAPPLATGACYPVVIYAHGTTGNAYGTMEIPAQLAEAGIATLGFDMPLHGERYFASAIKSQVEFYTFNFLNPASAATVFRQAAIDILSLVRMIQGGVRVPAAKHPGGDDVCLDSQRLALMGHSQGALTAAIALPFTEGLRAVVLSGGGAGTSITIVERDDETVKPQQLIRTFLRPTPEIPLTLQHPLVMLMQMAVGAADPLNYADDKKPLSVLHLHGSADRQTAWQAADALAAAWRWPLVEPVSWPAPAHDAVGLTPVFAPVQANQSAGVTSGYIEWRGRDHFVALTSPEGIEAWLTFLGTALDGSSSAPLIKRDPDSRRRRVIPKRL